MIPHVQTARSLSVCGLVALRVQLCECTGPDLQGCGPLGWSEFCPLKKNLFFFYQISLLSFLKTNLQVTENTVLSKSGFSFNNPSCELYNGVLEPDYNLFLIV